MTTLKRTLLILIPLAVIGVVWIVLTALQLANQKDGDIARSEPLDTGPHQASLRTNVFTDESLLTPLEKDFNESASNLLTNWQHSGSIRQADNIPEVTRVDTDQKVSNTSTTNATSTVTDTSLSSGTNNDFDAWGWVPQTTIKKPRPEKPSAQSPIKTYANNIGNEIKTTVATLGNQTKVMEQFIIERDKKDGMLSIGDAYEKLGVRIIHLTSASNVSEDVKKNGYELGSAYRTVGTATNFLAQQATSDDAEILELIYIYNGHIDSFAKRFISFATLLGAYGVRFNQGDGGDIFTPPSSL